MKNQSVMLKNLQNDDVFVKSEIKNLAQITGFPVRKGLEQAVISGGQIVNIVSDGYGHLPNELFFAEVERMLIKADIQYDVRSINRDNRSFAVDYILNDPNYIIKVKNSNDVIKPMLRFVNSYDGSCKTSGSFGFFRQVCANGLHVATSQIGFSVKHRGNLVEFVMPEIKSLVNKFMDNEYYTLSRKFEVLAETQIHDLKGFVKMTADHLKLFKFEASDKNPEPSLNARMVMDIVNRESSLLNERPNLWMGYNAFNELLHTKLKKTFEAQKQIDAKIFDFVLTV